MLSNYFTKDDYDNVQVILLSVNFSINQRNKNYYFNLLFLKFTASTFSLANLFLLFYQFQNKVYIFHNHHLSPKLEMIGFLDKKNKKTKYLPRLIGIPEKRKKNMGGWGHSFLKTTLEFLDFLIYPWKLQIKQSFTPRNSTKLCYLPWKF